MGCPARGRFEARRIVDPLDWIACWFDAADMQPSSFVWTKGDAEVKVSAEGSATTKSESVGQRYLVSLGAERPSTDAHISDHPGKDWACPRLADTNGAVRTTLEANLRRSSVRGWVRTADCGRTGAERSTFRWLPSTPLD